MLPVWFDIFLMILGLICLITGCKAINELLHSRIIIENPGACGVLIAILIMGFAIPFGMGTGALIAHFYWRSIVGM